MSTVSDSEILDAVRARASTAREVLTRIPALGDTAAAVARLKRLTSSGLLECDAAPGGNVVFTVPSTRPAKRSPGAVRGKPIAQGAAAAVRTTLGSSGPLRSTELWSACARAGVSKQSAKRVIAQLIASGEVRVEGKTRSAVYSMPTAGGSPLVDVGTAARIPPAPAVQQPRESEITDLLMDLMQTERRATAAMVRAAATSSDPVMRTLASALAAIRTAADVSDLGRREASA